MSRRFEDVQSMCQQEKRESEHEGITGGGTRYAPDLKLTAIRENGGCRKISPIDCSLKLDQPFADGLCLAQHSINEVIKGQIRCLELLPQVVKEIVAHSAGNVFPKALAGQRLDKGILMQSAPVEGLQGRSHLWRKEGCRRVSKLVANGKEALPRYDYGDVIVDDVGQSLTVVDLNALTVPPPHSRSVIQYFGRRGLLTPIENPNPGGKVLGHQEHKEGVDFESCDYLAAGRLMGRATDHRFDQLSFGPAGELKAKPVDIVVFQSAFLFLTGEL